MHNSFILQQYICYTTILNRFRAARCSSSGGQILSPQPLVSSTSVNSRTVCRWRADCSPLSTCILYGCFRGWRYQRLYWYDLSSWGWAGCCSKHVVDRNVTYILLKNKRIVHIVGNLKKSILWCTVRKTSKFLFIHGSIAIRASNDRDFKEAVAAHSWHYFGKCF